MSLIHRLIDRAKRALVTALNDSTGLEMRWGR